MTPLRQKDIDQMTLQGLSIANQKSYLYQLKEVAKSYSRIPSSQGARGYYHFLFNGYANQ